jgi:hypothetical protein
MFFCVQIGQTPKGSIFVETNLTSILSGFGVSDPSSIKQIYRSAWDIDDEYVLKTNKDKNQLKKSIFISRLLLSEEPRQLIHRDMHTSNMIFKDGEFSYLDFDMSQRNVRIFDIAYLGCSQLIDNYKDEVRLKQWREIFRGILQGYNQLLPLSEDELKAVPVLFVFIEVLFTAFFLKIGQPETAESCLKMTNWLFDNMSSLIC